MRRFKKYFGYKSCWPARFCALAAAGASRDDFLQDPEPVEGQLHDRVAVITLRPAGGRKSTAVQLGRRGHRLWRKGELPEPAESTAHRGPSNPLLVQCRLVSCAFDATITGSGSHP